MILLRVLASIMPNTIMCSHPDRPSSGQRCKASPESGLPGRKDR